jgi:hypothetical protein
VKHPFINDLSDKTLDQLQDTLANLTTKLNFAYRSGNQPLINQINMAMESYREESTRRLDELMDKQRMKTKVKVENDSNKT